MIRAPLPRAISRCISARSASQPFAFDAPNLDTFGGRADLALRLQRDALGFKAAMVDPRVDVEFGQALIGKLGPAFAPALDHLRAVPLPHLLAKAVLVPSPTWRMVSMTWAWGLGMPSSAMSQCTLRSAIMPRSHEFAPNEVAGEFDALCLSHLARDGEFDLAGELGILADFERLDIVPEPLAVAPCFRRILRQHHFGMDDAALAGKIVAAIKPLVAQPRARAVGG